MSSSTAADTSPASAPSFARTWKVPDCPGRSVSEAGLTPPKVTYFVAVNSYATVPWNPAALAEAKNTAVHLPGAGYRMSTCPWLPLPCGYEWDSYSPLGPMSASRTADCPLAPPPGQAS